MVVTKSKTSIRQSSRVRKPSARAEAGGLTPPSSPNTGAKKPRPSKQASPRQIPIKKNSPPTPDSRRVSVCSATSTSSKTSTSTSKSPHIHSDVSSSSLPSSKYQFHQQRCQHVPIDMDMMPEPVARQFIPAWGGKLVQVLVKGKNKGMLTRKEMRDDLKAMGISM